MCINPLLQTLEEVLTGVDAGRGKVRIGSVAYADDVDLPVFIRRCAKTPKCFMNL